MVVQDEVVSGKAVSVHPAEKNIILNVKIKSDKKDCVIHGDIIYLFKEVDDTSIWSLVFWDESPCDKMINDTLEKWWNWLDVNCKKSLPVKQPLASKPFRLSPADQSDDSLPELVFSSFTWPKIGTPS